MPYPAGSDSPHERELRLRRTLVGLASLATLAACRAPLAPPAAVHPPAPRPEAPRGALWIALVPGDSARLTAPAPGAIAWTSSDPAVVTVDATGLARAHALGVAIVTAALPGEPARAVAQIVATAPVLVGAGDIATCRDDDDDANTGLLLDSIPGIVFTAGDNAYPSGTPENFAQCYEPAWGRHKYRTRPSPGNHDYRTAGGGPYYSYFGPLAGDSGLGYYSYDFAGWHIISLNSNVPMSAGSPQERWLRADLAAHPAACTLAYWHHPRFSSGPHGNSSASEPLWQALYDANADVVVNGHDHTYERFAPQTPSGRLDTARGIREFVAGTGGAGLYTFPLIRANSLVRINTTHGVLKFTLHPASYDWEFIDTNRRIRNMGSRRCH